MNFVMNRLAITFIREKSGAREDAGEKRRGLKERGAIPNVRECKGEERGGSKKGNEGRRTH